MTQTLRRALIHHLPGRDSVGLPFNLPLLPPLLVPLAATSATFRALAPWVIGASVDDRGAIEERLLDLLLDHSPATVQYAPSLSFVANSSKLPEEMRSVEDETAMMQGRIESVPSLQTLSLSYSGYGPGRQSLDWFAILQTVGRTLRFLTTLDLSHIDGTVDPPSIGALAVLPSLTELRLQHLPLLTGPEAATALASLPSIRVLDVSQSLFTCSDYLDVLFNLDVCRWAHKLRRLNLDNALGACNKDVLLRICRVSMDLEHLSLKSLWNSVDSDVLDMIGWSMRRLKTLDIKGCCGFVEDEGDDGGPASQPPPSSSSSRHKARTAKSFRSFRGHPSLEKLSLGFLTAPCLVGVNILVGDDDDQDGDIAHADDGDQKRREFFFGTVLDRAVVDMGQVPHLKELHLDGIYGLSTRALEGLVPVASSCMKHLFLGDCHKLAEGRRISAALMHFTALETLQLTGSDVQDLSFLHSMATTLTALDITRSCNLTDIQIVSHLPAVRHQLKVLCMRQCPRLGDDAYETLTSFRFDQRCFPGVSSKTKTKTAAAAAAASPSSPGCTSGVPMFQMLTMLHVDFFDDVDSLRNITGLREVYLELPERLFAGAPDGLRPPAFNAFRPIGAGFDLADSIREVLAVMRERLKPVVFGSGNRDLSACSLEIVEPEYSLDQMLLNYDGVSNNNLTSPQTAATGIHHTPSKEKLDKIVSRFVLSHDLRKFSDVYNKMPDDDSDDDDSDDDGCCVSAMSEEAKAFMLSGGMFMPTAVAQTNNSSSSAAVSQFRGYADSDDDDFDG